MSIKTIYIVNLSELSNGLFLILVFGVFVENVPACNAAERHWVSLEVIGVKLVLSVLGIVLLDCLLVVMLRFIIGLLIGLLFSVSLTHFYILLFLNININYK